MPTMLEVEKDCMIPVLPVLVIPSYLLGRGYDRPSIGVNKKMSSMIDVHMNIELYLVVYFTVCTSTVQAPMIRGVALYRCTTAF